ncbi:MAG TPA: hypothetical protein VLA19_07660 [Herpetosiphonaceae bacterium]|nr:hypothetical protein [Herpetosiphonaceae bacterium]
MFFIVALLVVLAAMVIVARAVEARELTPQPMPVHIEARRRR